MPMSLKCMIGKWLHKGQISQEEYDAVIKKLEGHDKEIIRRFVEWLYTSHIDTKSNTIDIQIWTDCLLEKYEKEKNK